MFILTKTPYKNLRILRFLKLWAVVKFQEEK